MTIFAAADGSALGNPGPAGWGWYVDEHRWAAGGWPHGTNNMGELRAVLELVEQTADSGQDLHIYCDSQYVINSVTKWMANWKRNGWRKRDRSPVLNVELMKALDAAMAAAEQAGRSIRFEWVKGHTGHVLNEKADELATAAATALRDGRPVDAGPGWHDTADGPGPGPANPPSARTPDRTAQATGPDADGSGTAPDGEAHVAEAATVEVAELEAGLVTLSATRLAALLHPEWVRVTAAGAVQTREQVLAAPRPRARPRVEVGELVPLGPAAVLVRSEQRAGARSALCVSVWVRSAAGWQQRFTQFTSAG